MKCKKMSDDDRNYEMYVSIAAKIYKSKTGKNLKINGAGARGIAFQLTGEFHSKNDSKQIIKNYCGFSTEEVKNIRKERKRNKFIYSKDKSEQHYAYVEKGRLKRIPIVENDRYSVEKAKAFYNSPEWQRLRVRVIEKQKGECQMCGRSYNKHGVTIHVDHIVPLSVSWLRRLDIMNLQCLCEDCNLGKVNFYTTDWRRKEYKQIV